MTTPTGRTNRAVLDAALGIGLDPELLDLALTHRSYAYENGNLPTNERLEFLGDAVLGLVITDELYRRHPALPEGQLAKLRAAVVNMRALAEVAREIDLGRWVRLGRGEETTGGRDKASILADTLEALLGAVWLTGGLPAARPVVLRLIAPLLDRSAALGAGLDWKTSLQELAAARGLGACEYLVTEDGPDHAKTFTAVAQLGGAPHGQGRGASKKEAEQEAAAHAYRQLVASEPAGPGAGEPVAGSEPALPGRPAAGHA